MQRKYRLGDGLLTTADLEAMNKEDFTTIGAFVQKFKKRVRKVAGISEEAQCAIFLGLLTASEAVELTRLGGGSTKLTWATIHRGVEVGCLDQVEQRQVRLQRQKRKERDATASGTPGVTRIVTDVLAQLGYATEPVMQRRVVTVVQVKGTEPVVEEAAQEELWEEEEPVPQRLTKAQRKVRNLAQGGQGSGKAQAPQALTATPLNVAAPSSIHREAWLEVGTRGRAIKATEGGVEERGEAGMAAEEEGNGMVKARGTKAKGIKSKCGGVVPQLGMMGRPLTPQARLAQAARTRSQAKASVSQEPPRRELEAGKRKEAVEVEDVDKEEEDERLRREEDQRAEQRARKKGVRGEVESVVRDGPPKRKKYAVRLEEGFDVERVIDRLLEGHNDLMTLKEILASAPRLRDELKGRLSRRLVHNVHLGTILPKEAEWAESGTKMDWKCVACGTVDLVVKESKNRLNQGSFTIEQSESERRRFRAEPKGEEKVEAFSLILSDVGKAMDLVAAHEMADPDAIQALREQVLKSPAESLDQSGSLNPAGNVDEVPESQDDEFEEGEIKEVFRAEEYDGIYLELGLLLSCEMRLKDASDRTQRGHREVQAAYAKMALQEGIKRYKPSYQRFMMALQRYNYIFDARDNVSDFTKKVMPRGGKGTRPPQRPLGASGGYERHGPRHRESTPEYDGGDIELFLNSFWEHAQRMGWTSRYTYATYPRAADRA
ncbi:hypothetical protein CBR_g6504 [Chara braunii]|uniref:Uncharacterized protein n=1 Tax=Chara braunii TaxID=69332 RepID=A0A388KK24_CHABU|nr:hypothetical protein CBR_g6504 [Chara braunii]|eukprot:GBG70376.1 hypothetical protein CBR_g6504 [Chara braunii]